MVGTAAADVRDPFPSPRPATRAAAVALVSAGETPVRGCLTPQVQALDGPSFVASPAVRRALFLLQTPSFVGTGEVALAPDGTRVLYTTEASAFDRVSPADVDADGHPDLVEQVLYGIDQAHGLLVERLELPAPSALRVLLLELGPDREGYVIGGADDASSLTIVLDASAGADGEAARRLAVHQYAHAVALSAGTRFPREWGEALATWATLAVDGELDPGTAELLADRLERLNAGLLTGDLALAAGNALWLAFLQEAYGPAALRVTIEELAGGGEPQAALDRALRRVTGEDLASAFREFHLWSIFVGDRADRFHFSFAPRLPSVSFASTAEGLPALSVRADPSLAPWGATQIRIRPDSRDGGLEVRFEGEFTTHWEADLILSETDGTRRRLAIDLASDGQGEITVPLWNLDEALLLVRNLGSDDGAPRRYTYAMHREPGFPFELTDLAVSEIEGQGIDVSWETASERRLLGFNILRSRKDGGPEIAVNPVWIPALGDEVNATSYRFLDRDVDPEASYLYRVQGITEDGLTSLSEPVVVRRPAGR